MRTPATLAAAVVLTAACCFAQETVVGGNQGKYYLEQLERDTCTAKLSPANTRVEYAGGRFGSLSGRLYQPIRESQPMELHLLLDPASAKPGEVIASSVDTSRTAAPPVKWLTFTSSEITRTSEKGVLLVKGTWRYGDKEQRTSFAARLTAEKDEPLESVGRAFQRLGTDAPPVPREKIAPELKATMTLRPGDLGLTSPAKSETLLLTLTAPAKPW